LNDDAQELNERHNFIPTTDHFGVDVNIILSDGFNEEDSNSDIIESSDETGLAKQFPLEATESQQYDDQATLLSMQQVKTSDFLK
jgi:hypothetical protein